MQGLPPTKVDMDPSTISERAAYNSNIHGSYQRYPKPAAQALAFEENNWVTSPDVHITSFERSPPMVVDTPITTPSVATVGFSSSASVETDEEEEAYESDSALSGSRHCEISECTDDECEDGCEDDDCEKACVDGPCDGNCSLNNTADDCEDCVRCRDAACKAAECKTAICEDGICADDACKVEECAGADCADVIVPCVVKRSAPKSMDRVVAKGPVRYSASCDSQVPQQQQLHQSPQIHQPPQPTQPSLRVQVQVPHRVTIGAYFGHGHGQIHGQSQHHGHSSRLGHFQGHEPVHGHGHGMQYAEHGLYPNTQLGSNSFRLSPPSHTDDLPTTDGRYQKRRRIDSTPSSSTSASHSSVPINSASISPTSTLPPPVFNSSISPNTSILPPAFNHHSHGHPFRQYPSQQNFQCLWGNGCGVPFGDYYGLNNHVFQTHLPMEHGYVCQWESCGEAENNIGGLLNHVKVSHTSGPGLGNGNNNGNGHICLWQGCNASFANSEDLEHHLASVHMPPPNNHQILCQWEACGIETNGLDGLASHLHNNHLAPAVQHSQDRHGEAASDMERSISSSTSAHTESSSNSANVAEQQPGMELICKWCEEEDGEPCDRVFQTSHDLQMHTKDDHIAELRKKSGYFCKWEGCHRREKEFSQKGKVERHMQTHTGFKSCRCEFCDKEFSAPQALQQHIRTHTGEKPYQCDICGKYFAQGSAMTMHRRVHTGERPLSCDFPGCTKTFSESSNLSKHRKTHNAIGAHVCVFPGCPKSFHRLDQYRRHLHIHGNWVPPTGKIPPPTRALKRAAPCDSSADLLPATLKAMPPIGKLAVNQVES